MAVNKNFVVKNGLEVNNNLFLADVSQEAVGIGTSLISYKFHVIGGIGATDLNITGIATFPHVNLTGTVAAGSSTGEIGQYLVRSGAGVTWQTLPDIRSSSTTTATASQTIFTFSYTIGLLDVFVNGVKLSATEFEATDGVNIILTQPCFGGETVEFITYGSVNPGYAYTGIYGVTVKEEGSIVGNSGQIVSIDFVGAAVTAVGSGAGVTVYITDTNTLNPNYWEETSVGINTISNVGIATTNPRFALEVGPVGYADTALWVNGNARVTGILTVGTASIVLDGSNNVINVGSGVTINGSTGRIDATEFYASGLQVGIITAETIVYQGGATLTQDWTRTAAGIHTLGNVGIGTTNPTSVLTVKGNTSLETLSVSGVSTFNGNLRTNGANIKLGDGNEVAGNQIKLGNGVSPDAFGDSADLWIYHNSTANVFQDITATGIRFLTNDFRVRHESASADTIITNFTGNNDVRLYQGGNLKFETVGAGVTVYGTTFTNQLSVSGVTTSVGGFTSGIGVTDPVQITVSGNVLTFTVAGVGSTSLTLY